jgi:hypothetical protein
MSCLRCPVPDVLSKMYCPACPFKAAPSHLFLQGCSSAVVLTQFFCPGCPAPFVLSQLPCPSNFVRSSPDATVLSLLSNAGVCPLCPVQSYLTRLPFQANLSRLTCAECPVLSQMSNPNCPATVASFQLSCSSTPVLAVMF